MPVTVGKFNLAYANKGLYKSHNIVHDDGTWFILIDENVQNTEKGWEVIPTFQQQHALNK